MARTRDGGNVTVRDVAKLARVSTATVSRALSRPDMVRSGTRERIQRAIERLDYVSDGVARALSTRRTHTIGAVIPTLNNAIYAVSTHSLQKTLEQAGYTLLLACHEFDLAAEARMLRAFASRGVDALVLVGTRHNAETRKLLPSLGLPYVFTWAIDRARRHASVGFDNRAAGRMIAEYLLQLGHKRIGMVSGVLAGNDRARDRMLGVKAALERAGLALPPESVVQATYSLESGRAGLAELLRTQPVSAVVCGNDVLAIGAIQEAQRMGLDVPGELSVTGFDDMEFATVVTPALTTVRFPITDIGVEAARHIIERLDGKARPRCIELPLELAVRQSAAAPRRK
ncbi:MAG: LacI family DNA-binding transcriptional regulator [Casimicrobiaceae bacterium]